MKGSLLSLLVAVLCDVARRLQGASSKWPWQTTITWDRAFFLRLLGISSGIPTTVVGDGAVTAEALVHRADTFSNRPAGVGVATVVSNGRYKIITTVPHGPLWVALRRNLTSEVFHPVRGLARAAPYRARALAGLVADIAAHSSSGQGVVPVRDCLYAALFALNVAMCFGDGVSREQVEVMRLAQQEFVRVLPSFAVFGTFQKITKLFYWDRWRQAVHLRRRQEEMYLPLIRACQERRRTGANTTATSYVDTLLDLEVPTTEGDTHPHQLRRKLSEGEIVSLVSEYLGASTGTILAQMEWTLANLILQPDIQNRLRGEVEAAGGEGCAYLRAVVMESLRRHPVVPFVQRLMRNDVLVGSTPVARGTIINFSMKEIGIDGKKWTSPEEFIPDRFMPGGEGAGVRLTIGSKDTAEVKMMPFGAGRRICPGMGYALVNLEYFIANLVTTFEWHPVKGEVVDLIDELGFFITMQNPLRAHVVPRASPSSDVIGV